MKQGFKKCKMANLFWEKNMEKYPTGIKFAHKIILAAEIGKCGRGMFLKLMKIIISDSQCVVVWGSIQEHN